IPPKRSAVPAAAVSSAAWSVTSASNQAARSPSSAASAARRSGSSPTSATLAPRACSARAVAAPMPRAAPVMRTTLPSTGYRTPRAIRRARLLGVAADQVLHRLDAAVDRVVDDAAQLDALAVAHRRDDRDADAGP